MKIDTFITYILVYLLTCVRFNVYVPVKAGGGQTASINQQAKTSPVYTPTARDKKDGFDLNILTANDSTNKFYYKKNGQYVTYTAKGGNAFKVVKEGNTEVWKASDDNYSGRVEVDLMNNESKSVTVYIDRENFKVFEKYGTNESWTEIDVTKLKPIVIDVQSQNDSYFYTNKVNNNVRTLTAKNRFAFNVVKDGGTDIWTSRSDNEYATKVEYANRSSGIPDITIHLINGNKKIFIKENSYTPWKAIDISKVSPISVSIDYKHETHYHKNELKGMTRIFTAKTGFAFKGAHEFIDKQVEIWTTDNETEYAYIIEAYQMDNGAKAVSIFMPGNKIRLFKKDGRSDQWREIDITEVNRISLNIQDEFDRYFYNNRLYNNVRTFTAKKGFIFDCVKESNTEIWTTSNENEYAKKIEYANRSPGKLDLNIFLGNGKKKLFIKETETEGWKEIDISKINPRSMNIRYNKETYFYSNKLQGSTRTFEARDGFAFNVVNEYIGTKRVEIWHTTIDKEYAKKVVAEGEDIVAIYMGDGTIKAFKKRSDDNWSAYSHSTKQTKIASEPHYGLSASMTPTSFIDLNITSDTASTGNFDYTKDNIYVTYTAKGGNAFKVVKEGNTEVWKASDDNYSGRVEVDLMNDDAKAFTVYLGGDKNKVYLKSSKNGLWTEIDTSTVNPRSLNIYYQYDSFFYTNKLDNNVRTFEARLGFAFNGFREGENTVWTTNNVNEYANKVVSSKSHSGTLDVTIHLVNGGKLLFIKETETEGWKEIDLTILNPKTVNIHYQYDSYFYTNRLDNNVRTFTAKSSFAFNGFREGENTVWTTNNVNEYANKVVSSKSHSGTLDVTIHLVNGGKLLFIKETETEGWKEIDLTVLNPKTVNIHYQYDSYFYTNRLDNNVRTFTAKSSFAFNGFREGENNILTTSDVSEYANKVVSSKSHSGVHELTIHLVNGGKLLFIKETETEGWKEIDLTVLNFKTVNIHYQYDSYFYTNRLDNNVRTFTAKSSFAFNGFREGENNIWTTSDVSEYANKVEVDLMNNDAKAVTVYLGDKSKLFMKTGKNESWTELDTSKINLKSINIDDPHNSYMYNNTLDNDVRTFEAKTGFGFDCAIKYINNNKIELWKADKADQYANKIVSAKRSYGKLDLTIHLSDGNKKLFIKESDSEGWKEIDISQVDPRSMNIRYDKETYFYSNKLQGSTRTFEARDGFAFNVVNEYIGTKRVEIWHTTIDKEYAKKVVAKGDNKVTIYIGSDGTRKVFNKAFNGKWLEDPAEASAPEPEESSQPAEVYAQPTEATPTSLDDASRATTQSKVNLFKVNPSDPSNYLELNANEYTYTQSRNVAIYHINVDCVQLMLENDLLWVYDSSYHGGIHPKSVYHETTTNSLVLRFEGLDITFEKTTEGWTFTESGPLAVKFHLTDPNDSTKTVELTSIQLTVTTNGDVTTFNIADNVNSIALTYGPAILWQHDGNQFGGKHPKSLEFTTSTETLVLKFEGFDLTFEKNDQGIWEYTETDTSAGGASTTPPTDPIGAATQSLVKLLKANPSDPENPLDLDASEYTSTQSGDIVLFQIADGANCIQLMLGNDLLWLYDSTKHGGIYPKVVYHDTSTDVLLLRFVGLDITFEKTTEGWTFTESGPLAVKLYLVDPNDPNNTLELDSNQLTVTTNGDVTTFNIAENVNSIALIYGSLLLWQHDPNQQGDKYPNSLYYSEITETLVLRFEGFDLTFEKNDQGIWEYTETDTSAGGASTTPPTDPIGAATQSLVKLLKANPSDPENPLDLDASEYTSTQSGDIVLFQIADGANCIQLMLGNDLLWVYDSTKHGGIYPKVVYHDTSTDVLLLRFVGLDITFEKTTEGWTFTESGPLAVKFHLTDPNDSTKTVELTSIQLTVTTNGDVTTFNIADNVNSIALTYGPAILWQHDGNQFGGKHPKSLEFTTSTETLVLKFDGLDVKFAKNTGGQWEYTETDTSAGGESTTPPTDPSEATTQAEVKLLKANPSDAENPLELDAKEYTSTQSGDIVSYQIADGVDCVQLVFDNVLLWAHDPNQRSGKYPKSVHHDTSTDVLLLRFDGFDITFAKNDQGQWEYTEAETSVT